MYRQSLKAHLNLFDATVLVIRSGNLVQNIFTVVKVLTIMVLVIAALFFTAGPATAQNPGAALFNGHL